MYNIHVDMIGPLLCVLKQDQNSVVVVPPTPLNVLIHDVVPISLCVVELQAARPTMDEVMYGHAGGQWRGLTAVLYEELDDERHTYVQGFVSVESSGETNAPQQSKTVFRSYYDAIFDMRVDGERRGARVSVDETSTSSSVLTHRRRSGGR